MSIPSVDFTQLTALSEGNDKQSSKTLTESTIKESKEQAEIKNTLKHDKVSQETVTQNVSMSQVLDAAQSKEKQHSEAEESGSTGESIASLTEDPKQSIVPAPQTIQPG